MAEQNKIYNATCTKSYDVTCSFERRTFEDKETGKSIPYISCGVTVNGQYIKLSIPKESKPLLEYLLKDKI